MNPYVEIDLTGEIQHSWLKPRVKNVDVGFNRYPLLSTLKFKIPVLYNAQLKFGSGVGFYIPGDLHIDISKYPDGTNDIIKYNGAIGYHITGEFEYFASRFWSFMLGLKYHNVTYDVDSATVDGVSVPVEIFIDKVRKLNGSGVYFFCTLGWLFQ